MTRKDYVRIAAAIHETRARIDRIERAPGGWKSSGIRSLSIILGSAATDSTRHHD